MTTYEAHALRFASRQMDKAGRYHRYAVYGEADDTITLDFFFWLLRGPDRTVLVDCGYDDDRSAARGLRQDTHPLALLNRMDVRPEDVDDVIISHMHFDHVGNLDLFPNATFHLAQAELEHWTGPFSDRQHLNVMGDPHDIELVTALVKAGRVDLIRGPGEILPGIAATPVRGHTGGQLITEVSTAAGTVVVASDALHFYEEMELDRPTWIFCDLEGMYRGYEMLRQLSMQGAASIVAGHDHRVTTGHPEVEENCFDLTVSIPSAGS